MAIETDQGLLGVPLLWSQKRNLATLPNWQVASTIPLEVVPPPPRLLKWDMKPQPGAFLSDVPLKQPQSTIDSKNDATWCFQC